MSKQLQSAYAGRPSPKSWSEQQVQILTCLPQNRSHFASVADLSLIALTSVAVIEVILLLLVFVYDRVKIASCDFTFWTGFVSME